MKITTKELNQIRKVYKEHESPILVNLYSKMIDDMKPRITESMMSSTRLILEGNTTEEASSVLGVSKVAVSQSAIKGLNRLAEFWEDIGGILPEELKNSFNMPTAKRNLRVLNEAAACYHKPELSLSWDK
ncbi:hypothetical protein [Vibrio sp. Vb339]|uniref:hypothetical protein n=1 Tax=Vibrio sp. Vb339 TaxID=1192013 RepID=UPI0015518783|nr:hypothetical protein [Vibrio sp. Vb339]